MKVGLTSSTALLFVMSTLACQSLAQQVGDRIQQLYAEARSAEKQGRVDAAIEKYEAILKLDRTLPAAYSNIGRLYYQQGHLVEAIKPLKRACELDPHLEPPRALLGFSFYEMADYQSARREFQTALQLNPADRTAKLFLARSLFQLNDLQAALQLLDQLHRQDPKNTEVLYTLGLVHASLAQSTVEEIQTIDPDSYLIELLLARYSEIKQVYADAIGHYRKAIEKAPDVRDLYYRYAHALWASGDSAKALVEYRHVLTLNPYDYRANWEAGRIVLAEDPQQAFGLANRALELKPDIPEALTIRGRALLALHEPKKAIEDLKKASTLDPEEATNHFQLARAYRQLGLGQEAQNETAVYERMEKEAHTPKGEK